LETLFAALDRAAAREDGEVAIGLAFHTWRFWQKRGHLYEARRRLDAMAAADWSRRDPILRARLLEALGGVAWWQGDIKAMATAYEEAAAIWRAMENPSELANALYNDSFAYAVPDSADVKLGEADPEGKGRALLEEALALYRTLGDERGEANVLWGLGNLRYFSLDADPGSEEFALALEKFRRVGDRTMETWSLHMLAGALLRLGRLDEARQDMLQALRQFHAASDAAGVTLVLDDLSALAVTIGEPERGARLWGAARHLVSTTGATLATVVDDAIQLQVRANVRTAMAPDVLDRLAAEGAALTLDEAVAYALETPVSDLVTEDARRP